MKRLCRQDQKFSYLHAGIVKKILEFQIFYDHYENDTLKHINSSTGDKQFHYEYKHPNIIKMYYGSKTGLIFLMFSEIVVLKELEHLRDIINFWKFNIKLGCIKWNLIKFSPYIDLLISESAGFSFSEIKSKAKKVNITVFNDNGFIVVNSIEKIIEAFPESAEITIHTAFRESGGLFVSRYVQNTYLMDGKRACIISVEFKWTNDRLIRYIVNTQAIINMFVYSKWSNVITTIQRYYDKGGFHERVYKYIVR